MCVCVPGRIWLWQNVVNNGPSIEATRQDIQRDLGTWTARYVHLLLQGGAHTVMALNAYKWAYHDI